LELGKVDPHRLALGGLWAKDGIWIIQFKTLPLVAQEALIVKIMAFSLKE
jgi:hypothetical protein